MSMHPSDFLAMNLEERLQVLWDEGEFIARKDFYECQVSLFLLGNYYVEVFLNYELNSITSIGLQNQAQVLYAYVAELDIRELEKLLQ